MSKVRREQFRPGGPVGRPVIYHLVPGGGESVTMDARDHVGTVCPDCSAMMECPKHRAEHYPPSERPAKIAEFEAEAERRDDRDPLNQQHWLTFDREGKVVGCHCGFRSNVDQESGYGDDVVDHLLKVGRDSERALTNYVRRSK